jgi:alkylhydroperoxidase family enzyme
MLRNQMAPRIKPVDDESVSSEVREYFRVAEKRGAPNSTLLRILAREPKSLQTFYDAWNRAFYGGHIDHLLKEIVRVRMAGLRGCHY